MALKGCFEVERLIFNFGGPALKMKDEAYSVLEKVKKHLSKYASNTRIEKHNVYIESGDRILNIEFQKKISVNTINNILNHIFAVENKIFQTIYDGKCNEMKVIILK